VRVEGVWRVKLSVVVLSFSEDEEDEGGVRCREV